MQIFFYILLFLGFVGGNVLRFEFNNGYAVMLLDIVVLIAGIFILLKQNKNIFSYDIYKPLVFLLITFLISLGLQITYYSSFKILQGLFYIVRFGLYSLLLFFPTTSKTYGKVFLTVTGTVTLLLGFLQYAFYPMLRNLFYLGWDEHLYRLFGTLLDPNFMGILIVLFLLFSLHEFLQSKKYVKAIYAIFAILNIIALFLTFSRESYILGIIGLGLYALLAKKISIKLIVSGVGILLVTVILFIAFGPKSEGTKFLRTASLYQRFQSDIQAIQLFEKAPLLGNGYNLYRYTEHNAGFTQSDNWEVSHAGSGPENSYLLVLATAGIIGLIIYLFFWAQVVNSVTNQKEAAVLAASTITFLLSGLFINSLFYPFLLVWVFLLISIKSAKND